MTKALVVVFLTASIYLFHASKVTCSSVKNGATTKADSSFSPTRFVKLTAKRINATTVFITWSSGEYSDFQNATVQFRRSGGIDWQDWIAKANGTSASSNSSRFLYLILSNPCISYEIRLRAAIKNGGGKHYVSETVTSNSLDIPSRMEPTKPVLTRNFYNSNVSAIELIFSIENHTLATWPLDSRHLITEVHVIECSPVDDSTSDLLVPVPNPPVQWISNSKGSIQFGEPYISTVRAGRPCRAMVSVRGPAKVCGHVVTVDGELLDSAVFFEISCAATENMHCTDPKRRKTPSPRCNPETVDASKLPPADGSAEADFDELRVRWEFGRNTSETPSKILLRYGYTEATADADPLLAMLMPMHELKRFEVDGSKKDARLPTNKSAPDGDHEQSTVQRFYRISVCAIYGNDTAVEERKINWGIIPTFPVQVKNRLPNKDVTPQKRCRCEEENAKQLHEGAKSADPTTHSTTTAPPIVSAPSNQYENYWIKVAPLLATFTVMTVINLVLLMASYYYYKKARHLNAMK